MVYTLAAALDMVPRLAAVGGAFSPDGGVLSDLASNCLAYGTVVALRSLPRGLVHRSVGYTYESLGEIRVVDFSSVFRRCCILFPVESISQQSSRNCFFAPICPEKS